MRAWVFACLSFAAGLWILPSAAAQSPAPAPPNGAPRQYRALWVDAYHEGYRTPEQTQALVARARAYGFNTLFIEVRKAGDAYYRHALEPEGPEMAPGYDPLAHLVALCHDTAEGRSRIAVHAWMVVYRVATHGKALPANHILKRHPDWIGRTAGGLTREELSVYADPGAPGVIDHTAAVARDLLTRYEVDGLHLDYLRYAAADWGFNALAVARYQRLYQTSRTPRVDDEKWGQFRRDQVTAMMRRLYVTARLARPTALVSVATIAFGAPGRSFAETSAYKKEGQDWAGWLEEGILDLAAPMVYKRESDATQARDYRAWVAATAALARDRHVIIGQAGYLQSGAQALTQLTLAANAPGIDGVSLYSYAVPTRSASDRTSFWGALRARLFTTPLDPPAALWVQFPRDGLLAGVARDRAGRPVDGAVVAINGPDRRLVRADAGGFYAFARLPPGRYNVRATLSAGVHVDGSAAVTGGGVTLLDLRQP